MTVQFSTKASFAQEKDAADPLKKYRDRFHLPLQKNGEAYVYFAGNSLGCQPKSVRKYIETELKDWELMGVEGHFHARNPWMPYHEFLTDSTARIVGAKPIEVVVMNSLTANLHFLMVSFYRPTAERYKIVIEADAFPSDIYATSSQLQYHGYDPAEGLIKLRPREGEHCIRTEDIESLIEQQGDEIALIMLGGVNYYTGQAFEMKKITEAGHKKGIVVGFDLAHAAGNLPLQLHDWNVDFAAWCSYKYLNSGPGGVAACFVHERHAQAELPRFAGWWGHDKERRFLMEPDFVPIPGAEGWQLSNAPILAMASLQASLEIFEEVGMKALCEKSRQLTGYLEYLLNESKDLHGIEIITPDDPAQRGCQLSLICGDRGRKLYEQLTAQGVICDWREPDVIRVAPVPLYNSFTDAWRFVEIIRQNC